MSNLPENFRNMSPAERLKALVKSSGLSSDEAYALRRGLCEDEVSALTENGIGFMAKEGTFDRKVWNERYPHVVVIGELRELLPLVQESSVAESYA